MLEVLWDTREKLLIEMVCEDVALYTECSEWIPIVSGLRIKVHTSAI